VTGSREAAVAAARAAASKQAHDVVVLDVRDLIVITDYFVIASGTSDRQVRTIADEIEREVKARGLRPVRREGQREGRWVLLDFVDFVAHVFDDRDREYYGLERLWSDAPSIGWEERAARSGSA
jgi:ribosome-associated protein